MKKLILGIILLSSILLKGQNKQSEELAQMKLFLPYIIESLGKEEKKDLDQRTVKNFIKPWKTKKLSKKIADNIINSIDKNKKFKIEKDNREKWNLNFYSRINKNEVISDIYNSNEILCNTFIEISEAQLINENNKPVLDNTERMIKINQGNPLNFYSGGIENNFPIKKKHKNISGSIKINLKEYQKIYFKEFKNNDKNKTFSLGDIEGIRLIKIKDNKAYFYLPKVIENIKVTSTNKLGEEFGEHAKIPIPKKIYDYGISNKVNDKKTKEIIESTKIEDIKSNPQILIYETNGTIENLFIFFKNYPY